MDSYKGFYKVDESGMSLTIAVFYNPDTKESFSKRVWDIDDDRLLEDDEIQVLRYLPVNKNARYEWLHNAGSIQIGDMARVIKGRKLPIGKIGKVEAIKPYYDRYHRWQADYIYFEDGTKTNINNCVLV